jgi:hypothetical protein
MDDWFLCASKSIAVDMGWREGFAAHTPVDRRRWRPEEGASARGRYREIVVEGAGLLIIVARLHGMSTLDVHITTKLPK